MASQQPRVPSLALAGLSAALNLAILACAARVLHVFQDGRRTEPYFLPTWNDHFDTRELSATIGTSAVVFVCNLIFLVALLLPRLPPSSPIITLTSGALSASVSLVALVFSSVLNHRAPYRDTLQTWTCKWRDIPNAGLEGVPRNFDTLCHESRFAYYTTIPTFLIQLMLLTLAARAVFGRRVGHGTKLDEEEKEHYELGGVRQHSASSTKGSMRSSPVSVTVEAKYH